MPFHIADDVTIPAGAYRFGQWTFRYTCIAYDELRLDADPIMFDPHVRRSPWLSNRQLAIKMTYLLSR